MSPFCVTIALLLIEFSRRSLCFLPPKSALQPLRAIENRNHPPLRLPSSTLLLATKSNLGKDAVLIGEKVMDTFEDAALHARRFFRSKFGPELKPELRITQSDSYSTLSTNENGGRKRIVVLGAGWASHAFSKIIDTELFEVICISPRPFFLFTPMLPASAVGAIEYRSIIEPIRSSNPELEYIQGEVVEVNPNENYVMVKLTTTSCINSGSDGVQSAEVTMLKVAYDNLVYGVGSDVSDFGTKGVKKYCHFIKEIDDVKGLKLNIIQNFEKATLRGQTLDEMKRLLHFVVVGGGPTGVEFCGDLADFIREEVCDIYPQLLDLAKITLVNSGGAVLQTFDVALQESAMETLRREGIEIIVNARVNEVTADNIIYSIKGSEPDAPSISMDYGLCVWAAGVAPRALTKQLAEKLSEKEPALLKEAHLSPPPSDKVSVGLVSQSVSVKKRGRILVDPWLRAVRMQPTAASLAVGETGLGAAGSAGVGMKPPGAIFVIGDCAGHIVSDQVLRENQAYFARRDGEGGRTAEEPTPAMLSETELVAAANVGTAPLPGGREAGAEAAPAASVLESVDGDRITLLPQTGQVAAQQGAFVARLLNRQYTVDNFFCEEPPLMRKSWLTDLIESPKVPCADEDSTRAQAFHFLNFGILASLGNNEAVAQVQLGDSQLLKAAGSKAYLLWQSVYIVKQVSLRTRVLVVFDILKSKIFGKDLTTI